MGQALDAGTEIAAGTDREDIARLVRAFYRDVATDDLLGPIFEGMGVDWPAHVATLTDFWAWQLLGETGTYRGNPLRAHEPVHARYPLTDAHDERWLELFTATIDAELSGPIAEVARQRAARMAAAMHRRIDSERRRPASHHRRCHHWSPVARFGGHQRHVDGRSRSLGPAVAPPPRAHPRPSGTGQRTRGRDLRPFPDPDSERTVEEAAVSGRDWSCPISRRNRGGRREHRAGC